MSDAMTPLRRDFEEGGFHPRDIAFRTHIPFDTLMAMWRGEAPISFSESASIARITGRRSDFYQTPEDVDHESR